MQRPFALTLSVEILIVAGLLVTGQSGVNTNAQSDSTINYTLWIYTSYQNPSVDTPFRQFVFPASSVQCNRDPAPAGPVIVVDPGRIQWQDPSNASKICFADLGSSLSSLPPAFVPYLATLTATNESGASDASAPSNIFFRLPK